MDLLGIGFPSPYGVSFIFTIQRYNYNKESKKSFRLLMEYHSFLLMERYIQMTDNEVFLSPYGVSFILTK